MLYHEFRAMNTSILLAADGPADEVLFAFPQVQAFIEACEKRFTRFSETSELSALNRSAGTWFDASPEMIEVVSLALTFHQKTRFGETRFGETRFGEAPVFERKALFDPSVLDSLEHAGYDRTMEQVKAGSAPMRPGSILPPHDPSAAASFADTQVNPERGQIYLPSGLRIDLGGIAKGWIAEQAGQLLSSAAPVCGVDAGGDVFFHGLPPGETHWRIAIEDPWDATRSLAVLNVQPGAVATSSIMKRNWKKAGRTMHHLIDPRTMQPAETNWVSVTVIAPHTAEAEVYAKCLLIGGQRIADQVTEAAPGIEFIAVNKNKQLWGSKHSRELLDV